MQHGLKVLTLTIKNETFDIQVPIQGDIGDKNYSWSAINKINHSKSKINYSKSIQTNDGDCAPKANYNMNLHSQSLPDNHTRGRIVLLKEIINNNTPAHVHENTKQALFALCAEYNDIFYLPNDQLTVNNFYTEITSVR